MNTSCAVICGITEALANALKLSRAGHPSPELENSILYDVDVLPTQADNSPMLT